MSVDAATPGPTPPPGGAILAVGTAVTAEHADAAAPGELIVVARTDKGEYRAVSSSRGPVRAAVSVALAAGNHRLWNDAPADHTTERSTRSMPEILRAAAEADGFTSAYVGCIRDDEMTAVAAWFVRDEATVSEADRATVLQRLTAASVAEAERAEAKRAAAPPADLVAGQNTSGPRTFDPNDPTVDAETGLATKDEFDQALEDYESDEATLVLVALDQFPDLNDEYGDDVAHTVLLEIADRLVSACRSQDLIARVGNDMFAILLTDASRSVGLQIAKRLLDDIAQPLDADGPDAVTATIALAHQVGLVDTEELMESADDAVASGQRSGRGRLVVAN